MKRNKPELLAPAGDLERLKYALHYGADAVYIGGPFLGLRANAINFTFDEIKEGVEYAHKLNKKVYVTVNIVLHDKEIKEVDSYLEKLKECNIDAIIVSDLTIIEKAIEKGIHLLMENDVLLILGKGHEEFMIIGKEKIPFNDKKVVLDYLKKLSS